MYSADDTPCWVGFPIRISTDQRLLAAPHGFSQRATSFIASWCQGIHRMPLSRSKHQTHAQEPPTLGCTPNMDKTRACTLVIPSTQLSSLGASVRTPQSSASEHARAHSSPRSDQHRLRHAQMRTNLFTLTKNTNHQATPQRLRNRE